MLVVSECQIQCEVGDLLDCIGDLIGGLTGYRPHRRPYRFSYDNLVGDVKDNDRLADDLGINAGDVRIDLTVDSD